MNEEKQWTVTQLAEKWGTSYEFVRREIKDEPGVRAFVRQKKGRNRRTLYRIPDSVRLRIEQRNTV